MKGAALVFEMDMRTAQAIETDNQTQQDRNANASRNCNARERDAYQCQCGKTKPTEHFPAKLFQEHSRGSRQAQVFVLALFRRMLFFRSTRGGAGSIKRIYVPFHLRYASRARALFVPNAKFFIEAGSCFWQRVDADAGGSAG